MPPGRSRAPAPPSQSWMSVTVVTTVRGLIQVLLGFYFRRIEPFRLARVPRDGPVLFVSNHPGSITDAFIVGTILPRRVHFLGTVLLFRSRPVAWLLRTCGVIPVNRRQDDPAAMNTVADTFASCFEVLEAGGAVAVFPEGITYDDGQLKEVKSGAARIALELEDRHGGGLGLRIVPIGLSYAEKDRYRSDVLVHVGEPFLAADYLTAYAADPRAAVHALRTTIEQRLRRLILDTPTLEHARLVDAVKRLYLDRLRAGNLIVTEPLAPRAEELVLGQAIEQAVRFVERTHPDRLSAFVDRLDQYERRLRQLGLTDATVARAEAREPVVREAGATLRLAAAAPIAAYGWLHRLLPVLLIEWAVRHLTHRATRRAQTAHAAMLAGLLGFGVFYGACIAATWRWLGWPAALAYAMSLPLAGLVAQWFVREIQRNAEDLRGAWLLWRLPMARRRLERMRQGLVADLTALRREYRQTLEQAPPAPAVPRLD